MVSDHEIAQGVETVLRHSDPNAVTSLNSVVHQLEVKLGLNLTHKADFIRDQITFLLRSQPVPTGQLPPHLPTQYPNTPEAPALPQPFRQSHFTLQKHQPLPRNRGTRPAPVRQPSTLPVNEQNAAVNASETPKGRTQSGTKRRGRPGGLNKVCSVTPKLQVIVGEPALSRTEIVKQLWAYIRKHNLQDPGNKKKIICDDALRSVFETDCTDMFKMNKLLSKHILPLVATQQSDQAKKLKAEDESAEQNPENGNLNVKISDPLAKFFGTGETEMLRSEALGRVWEYIKVNKLEDPLSPMVVYCDLKLKELLRCESISALGVQEILVRHHLYKI